MFLVVDDMLGEALEAERMDIAWPAPQCATAGR